MCEEQTLRVCGPYTLLARLEAICVALEQVQDVVIVCAEACEGHTEQTTVVAHTLRHAGYKPLGIQLGLLSSVIASLKDRATF